MKQRRNVNVLFKFCTKNAKGKVPKHHPFALPEPDSDQNDAAPPHK
jgi:hypothetical protein